MKKLINNLYRLFTYRVNLRSEEGSAMVIALLIMMLLMGFVALAITRTTGETMASSNDAAESRTFDACHASLELMTKNFSKVFENKLTVDGTDITRIEGQDPSAFPEFADYNFAQNIEQTGDTESVILSEGQYQGLTALRDEWEFQSPCQSVNNGVRVELRRRFFNNRIPIFQFGIFYDDDLEFHPGPRFDFGGRVHANGHMFLAAQTGLYFSSKVTAKGHIFSNVQKNGHPATEWGQNVFVKNASGVYQQLTYNRGSALTNGTGPVVTTNPLPTARRNVNWAADHLTIFQGNLLAEQRPLDLPLKINSTINGQPTDLRELVKRGKAVGDLWNDGSGSVAFPAVVPVTATTADDRVTSSERYYNKTGLRINLADSKARLPGCWDTVANAVVAGRCGIRLDGDALGLASGPVAGARGYVPKAMTDGYQATRINGERFLTPSKEVWIKVETIRWDAPTQAYVAVDVTEEILSLGVTERAPSGSIIDPAYNSSPQSDSRSVIKLQRFAVDGPDIPGNISLSTPNDFTTYSSSNNYVVAARVSNSSNTNCRPGGPSITLRNQGDSPQNLFTQDSREHFKASNVGSSSGNYGCIVAFPINMFDTREGLWNDTNSVFNPTSTSGTGNYGTDRVPWAGVMSMVDIDVQNLRDFLEGVHNTRMPAIPGTPFHTANNRGLRSTDIPQSDNDPPKSGGWVLYVSDRRGDYDFDGQYDMEDIYQDGNLQPGEDFQFHSSQPGFGVLQAEYGNEAVRYRGNTSLRCENTAVATCEYSDKAAVFEHRYFRRGVRLIRGQTLPGIYDSVTQANTRGFTVASENAVYVKGNYNATGVSNATGHSQPNQYLPQNTSLHIPASVAADAVIILSNDWLDANSFTSPFSLSGRVAGNTTMRFAILAGDTQSSLDGNPDQGGGDPRMNGGVHNFKRFLENWGGRRLSYSGSLINMFNSQSNNGAFKCCNTVYNPPDRNWVFDSTFLNINRIPPGTPFFQSIQITGFQRVN
jgi:hypothetical protein